VGTGTRQKEDEGCLVAAGQDEKRSAGQEPLGWEVSIGKKVGLQGVDSTSG